MNQRKQSDTAVQLVALLDTSGYADGDTLGAAVGISRAAVWKQLHRLGELGAPIESVRGKGYRLRDSLRMLDADRINHAMLSAGIELPLELFETIDSTNRYGRELSDKTLPRLIAAEHQSSGRGRFQRSWISPFGRNLYLTLIYPMRGDLGRFGGLSLVAGLALHAEIAERIAAAGGDRRELKLKWPNDLYWRDEKLAGILIEARAELNGEVLLIIGLGINVNMLPADVDVELPPWTSIRSVTGKYIDRSDLAGAIAARLVDQLGLFERTGFGPFRSAWEPVDYLAGSRIKVNQPTGVLTGTAAGVSGSGELLLRLDNGDQIEMAAGDATLARSE